MILNLLKKVSEPKSLIFCLDNFFVLMGNGRRNTPDSNNKGGL